ncbi:MAG: glycosyltransferase, partial [Candidatus Aminicenantes bacterium]|nr:glycosyltransferase [Candidatus Aminicenantes bacterium]
MSKNRKITPASIVVTVKNESHTIEDLLYSLENQTTTPKEIVIIDAGSNDGTVKIIKRNMKKNKKIKLIIHKGASIARGRNLGVSKATSNIIAMTDAGCKMNKKWLFNITKPFSANQKIGLVSGTYKMTGKSLFQEAVKPYLGIPYSLASSQNFLPSTRSMAFRKSVFEKIGGFSEDLDRAGEDTLFNYQAKKMGVNFYFSKNAIVDWEVPSNLKEAFKKFFYYAKGDVQTGIWWHPEKKLTTHNIKIIVIYFRYFLGLTFLFLSFFRKIFLNVLIFLFFLYPVWALLKNYHRLERKLAVFLLPFIQIISDFAVMIGFASGV